MGLVVGLSGCQHPSVTAISLNPHYCDHKFAFLYDPCKEPEGIPFYLPKPLLIVSKNFRNIEETKVGLTDSAPIPNFFDDQAKYADLNARTNFAGLDGNAASGTGAQTSGDEKFPTADAKNLASVAPARVYSGTGAPISPGAVASDGLKPEAFYTYHIIFVPDLTQKYGLKIKGGAGEIRAAMNLVNGWQFTGLGPYYMKDSSTAQNTLSAGITANLAASGVADVVKAVAGLNPAAAAGGKVQTGGPPSGAPKLASLDVNTVRAVADALRELNPKFLKIPAYAEISIYEPYLSPENTMEWRLVAEKSYDRTVVATSFHPKDVLGLLQSATVAPAVAAAASATAQGASAPAPGAGAAEGGGPGGGPSPGTTHSQTGTPPVDDQVPRPEEVQPRGKLPQPPSPSANPGAAPGPQSRGPSPRASSTPADTRVPDVLGPRASLTPGATLQRASIRTPLTRDDAKADNAVVRTQDAAPSGIPFSLNTAAVSNALGRVGGASAVKLSLARAVAVGDPASLISSSANPAFNVQGLPPNTTIELRRDQQVVSTVTTGPTVPASLLLTDNVGVPTPGNYTYDVVRADPNQPAVSLGQIVVQVQKGNATTVPSVTSVPPTPVTTGAVLASDIVGRFFTQVGALTAAPRAAPAAAPLPNIVVPAAPPSSGNQVTLNQFFGRTKFPAPAPADQPQRFSLFHRKQKERPKVQTLALSGIDADAAAIAAAKIPPVPSPVSPSPKPTP